MPQGIGYGPRKVKKVRGRLRRKGRGGTGGVRRPKAPGGRPTRRPGGITSPGPRVQPTRRAKLGTPGRRKVVANPPAKRRKR